MGDCFLFLWVGFQEAAFFILEPAAAGTGLVASDLGLPRKRRRQGRSRLGSLGAFRGRTRYSCFIFLLRAKKAALWGRIRGAHLDLLLLPVVDLFHGNFKIILFRAVFLQLTARQIHHFSILQNRCRNPR